MNTNIYTLSIGLLFITSCQETTTEEKPTVQPEEQEQEQEQEQELQDEKEKEVCINEKKKQSTKKYITLFGTITNVVKGGCGFIKCDDPLETGIYVFTETKKLHKGDKVKFRTINIIEGDKQHFQKASNVRLVRETNIKQVQELLS